MHVLHLLDTSAGWQQQIGVGQLLHRLPQQGVDSSVASIDADTAARLRFPDARIEILPQRLGLPALAGSAIRSFASSRKIELIQAWGVDAAVAARAAFPSEMPLAVTVFDPGLTERDIRVLRTIGRPTGFAVACASGRVRRRLVERGVPLEQTVVLRPAVDFAAITSVDVNKLRQELNLPQRGQVMLTPPAIDLLDGHKAAVWSVLMRSYLDDDVRIVIPGVGETVRRLRSLSQSSEHPEAAVFSGDRIPFENLCALADWLVIGSVEDISLTAMAWAMAASTPIVAPATYATTELLADGLNARLFKSPGNWRRRGAVMCAQFDRTEELYKIKEAARGQAYEVFGLRRMAEQHQRLFANLSQNAPPADSISDPAMLAG